MIYIVVERLFPTVSTLIKQVEPPSHVAQPDSVAAVAVLYLGEIAVVAHKREVAVAFREAEPYERLMAVAEAMLVGVLNEAYQQQGGNSKPGEDMSNDVSTLVLPEQRRFMSSM